MFQLVDPCDSIIWMFCLFLLERLNDYNVRPLGMDNKSQIHHYRDIELCNMHIPKDGENHNNWLLWMC